MSVWMCVWSFFIYFFSCYFLSFCFYIFGVDFRFWGKVVDISCWDGILIHGFNDWKCYTLMYEYMYIAVIPRGESGNCFPAEICEGESTQSCEARFSPSRSPFPGTLFWTYVVVCDTFCIGRWIRLYREFKAEPMNESGRKSGPHSGPVPWYEIYILWYLTESSKSPAELRKAISSGWGLACIRRSAGSIW